MRIAAVGDLMVHEQQLKRAKTADGYDFCPSFEPVAELLRAADLTVGNFETTLPGPKAGYAGYPCFKTPDSFAEALKTAGFDLLSTSNNHSLDSRIAGLARTLKTLRGYGFSTVGTYLSQKERKRPLIKTVNGIRLAFLSWTYGTNGIKPPSGSEWAVASLEAASRDIARARALSPDIIIAMPHIGVEYRLLPPQFVEKAVDEMLRAGADVVIASHPHVLQPFEFRRVAGPDGKSREVFVAWSLGNFISFQRTAPRDVGAILELEVKKTAEGTRVASACVVPTWVQIRQNTRTRTVRVLPVGEALSRPASFDLRPEDLRRLSEAHKDFTSRILGRDVLPENAALMYKIDSKPDK